MDIHNYYFLLLLSIMDIQCSIIDIHDWIMDIHN